MSKIIIAGNPDFTRMVPQNEPFINVAEFFCDTIQGENFVGWPAAFLRVQHCTQSCVWCCVARTKILMSDFSYKSIEDVKIGDFVKTYTGKGLVDTKVVDCLQRDDIDTVLIHSNTNALECSFDHRLVSYNNHTDSKKIQQRLVSAAELQGRFVKSIPNFTMQLNESNEYKLGYVKGVLKGDGSCCDPQRLKLECCDREMIDCVLLYLKDLFEYEKQVTIKESFQKNRKTYYRCVLTTRSINDQLLLEPTLNEMPGFVAGFFDAEGTYGKNLSIAQNDVSVLQFIQQYLVSLGFTCSIDSGKCSSLRVVGGYREHVRFFNTFTPKISRKRDKIYTAKKIDGGDVITSIESRGRQRVFTLTTEQGYYIANNFLSKNCDTKEVWRFGNPYTFDELYELMEQADLIRKFREGQHLVLTGGSPVLAQDKLVPFIDKFINRYGFKPYIEIENEATRMPSEELIAFVDCWNNSPKLKNSLTLDHIRYKPEVLKKLASLNNSWFKFVVASEEDWKEIESNFLTPGYIRKNQIVLMPLGASREELATTRETTINIAIRENVRYSTREHIVIWNRQVSI